MVINRTNVGRGNRHRASCIAFMAISLCKSVSAETSEPRIFTELLKTASQVHNYHGILETDNSYSLHNFFCNGGTETYTVPSNTWMLTVHVYGAQGGSGYSGTNTYDGGHGGYIAANISVTPGQLLYVNVGCEGGSFSQQPYNGGGRRDSTDLASMGGGGGATDIRTLASEVNTRLIVAGGGGGGSSSGAGGSGGGQIGGDGFGSGFGSGGTQLYGGFCKDCIPEDVQSGTLGSGGMPTTSSGGGGGGGGYWGGGCGGRTTSESHSGGGGGGSSVLFNGIVIANEQGARRGDGLVSIILKSRIPSTTRPHDHLDANFPPKSATVCNAGQYLSSGYCYLCAPGTYSASPGALSCSACPVGSFNPDSGATSCGSLLCPAGTYSPAGSPVCITCLAGSYSGVSSASCTPCTEGHYATTGSSCMQCQSGSYSNSAGSASCKQCPLGYFSGPAASSCTACDSA